MVLINIDFRIFLKKFPTVLSDQFNLKIGTCSKRLCLCLWQHLRMTIMATTITTIISVITERPHHVLIAHDPSISFI